MVIRRKMTIQIFYPQYSTYRRTSWCSRTEAGSADWGSKNTGQARLMMSPQSMLILVIKQSPCTVACNFTPGDLQIEIYYCRSKSSSLFFFFSFIRCIHQHPQYMQRIQSTCLHVFLNHSFKPKFYEKKLFRPHKVLFHTFAVNKTSSLTYRMKEWSSSHLGDQ